MFFRKFWKIFSLEKIFGTWRFLGHEIRISAQEGRRVFSDTANCSQSPHLYTTYEATYSLKCMVWEIKPKNCILCLHRALSGQVLDLVRKCMLKTQPGLRQGLPEPTER